MLQNRKLVLSAVLLVLAMCMTLLTGNAQAAYVGDGAVQNGITGGWNLPVDTGVCVTGIQSDGTFIVDSTIHSRPDCIAKTLPAYTTQSACGNTANADGAHFWASTCVDASGNGISLSGLDRNANICAQKTGTWKNACTSAWQHMGPSGTGAEGFCYAAADVSSLYAAKTDCPTTTGYSWSSTLSKCIYSFGIAGYNGNTDRTTGALVAIKNLAGGTVVAAGASFDASAYANMGQCIYNGFSWNNYAAKTGTATLATTPNASTIGTGVSASMEGCLRCHNSTTQYNSYAERWKETYNKTGHKNMLRKVTAGMNWAGPDGGVYTTDGTNSINFVDGTANVGGTARKLFYIFGDWMAPNPTLVYDKVGDGVTSNGYSCAACHTTGWSNVSAGVCYPDSTKTTSAACVSPNTWVPSQGVQGTVGAQPQASYPGITGITGKWDIDGIQCSRCHESTWPVVYDASGNATTGTHNGGDLSSGFVNNLCYGCHQSPATNYVAGSTISGVTYPANAKILDPTMIPTGVSHGANWGRDFNGHVLGNSFLNSVHSRFTGSIVPNKLGKYDIAGGTYASNFSGLVCRTSTTLGSGSILKTKADGTLIKNLADCNAANNKPAGTVGYWQSEGQGKCTTCHDVHQSIVPAVGAAEPFVRECGTCHEDSTNAGGYKAAGVPQTNPAIMSHPNGRLSPFDTSLYKNACEKCHMPKSTSEGFPMHLWRINTDASYDTFPSRAAFYGGSCSINPETLVSAATCTLAGGTWTAVPKDRRAKTAADGAYANAVWVDLDAACGQCHGGGTDSTSNPAISGVPYFSKPLLAVYAKNIHNMTVDASFNWSTDRFTSYLVYFDASSTVCSPAGSSCSYAWDFGDSSLGTGVNASHGYASSTPVTVTLTATNITTGSTGSISKTVTPASVNTPPVASKTAPVVSGMNVSFTDTSTDAQDAQSALAVTVRWGDGTSSTGKGGDVFTKTYTLAGTYTIRHSVTDTGGLVSSSANSTVSITEKYSISGTVLDGSSAPVAGATMQLKQGTTVKRTLTTGVDGTYSFTNLLTGCYIVQPAMTGKTFNPANQTVCVGPSKTAIDFTAN